MRLSQQIASFLLDRIKAVAPDAQVFLFGSRVDDSARGGDIDICILSDEKIGYRKLSQIRIAFFKTFGFRKLDLVNYVRDDTSVFKQIILADAINLEHT